MRVTFIGLVVKKFVVEENRHKPVAPNKNIPTPSNAKRMYQNVASTSNQLYKQTKHRKLVIHATQAQATSYSTAQAQATSYTGSPSTGN